ncbi:MAG TPA: TonB-dependent receptor plug domain-containing protein, partial [Sphingomonas sp.]
MKQSGSSRGRGLLWSSTSLATLALLAATGARAQTAPAGPSAAAPQEDTTNPADDSKDILVVGVRRALNDAAETKRNAATVVDSISATDIGAFPDTSVSGALSRIPGITVSRLQSTDDSTHPSGEAAGVLVRGLTQVRTEFNGRDSFSADAARGLNFNDISPELMSRVDVYKNLTADMIEGGIAGTVDLRTRLPFDQNGLVVTGNGKADYGDRSKKWTGEFSALISDTFDTEIGKFGFMADYARSHVITRTESVIMDKIDTYCTSVTGVGSGGTIGCTGNPFGGSGWAFVPDGVRFSQVDYDRTRRGIALAGQYQDKSERFLLTVQYTDSKYHNSWLERASHVIFDGNAFGTPAFNPRTSTILGAADGTPALVFGSNGMLQSGTLTQGHGS